MKRLTKVTFKTWFHRRQRESIKLFRRYSVKNDEIDPDELHNSKKEFDMCRVVDECNYDLDLLDRRIMYEMTGERLTPEDFPDSTSESAEESGSDDQNSQGSAQGQNLSNGLSQKQVAARLSVTSLNGG